MNTQENVQKVAAKLSENERHLNWMVERLEWDLEAKRQEIVRQANYIQATMANLTRKLEQDGIDASFNELGEIQSKGNELDRMLGELATMRKMYQNFGSI